MLPSTSYRSLETVAPKFCKEVAGLPMPGRPAANQKTSGPSSKEPVQREDVLRVGRFPFDECNPRGSSMAK